MYIYIYYVHIYIYVYIYRERERERDRDRFRLIWLLRDVKHDPGPSGLGVSKLWVPNALERRRTMLESSEALAAGSYGFCVVRVAVRL